MPSLLHVSQSCVLPESCEQKKTLNFGCKAEGLTYQALLEKISPQTAKTSDHHLARIIYFSGEQ